MDAQTTVGARAGKADENPKLRRGLPRMSELALVLDVGTAYNYYPLWRRCAAVAAAIIAVFLLDDEQLYVNNCWSVRVPAPW